MASSQTSSYSQKRDQIIDGRLFSRSTVMDRIISEVEDDESMERIISKIEEQGLYRLGRSHPELYDELIVEEFYRVATVKIHSRKHGGGIIHISASIQDISVCINQELLVSMFGLPSDGLTTEELESFGSDELLTAYWGWGLFTGKSSNKDVHPSCPKKKFCLPFIFLHDFCCRIIENRTGAFDTCTNLRFRMMIAILYGEKVNWSQIVLKRLSEEVSKPHSQKKSFGLLLNNILTRLGIQQSKSAKKIGTDKFGGFKPSAYHQAGPTADRPFLNQMPSAKKPRGVSSKSSVAEEESSKKRKRSDSDSKSPLVEKKKHKKASKSKLRGTVTDPVIIKDVHVAQPTDHQTEGETPAVKPTTSQPILLEPTASNDHILDGLENLSESTAHIESFVSSPDRVPIPEQDPTPYRVPSPSRDPTPDRVPSPVKDSSPIQDPTPVEDPIPTENPIPVRSPSPEVQTLSNRVDQAFARLIKWKSYRTASYDVLINWKDLKEEEEFILEVTDSKEILLLFKMNDEDCKELIYSHYLDLNSSRSTHFVQPDSTPVPVAVSEEAERQKEPESTPIPVSSETGPSHAAASTSIRRPESPRSVARKE
ncbi:hypothetical protein OROMI_026256 [Orobanche minor]